MGGDSFALWSTGGKWSFAVDPDRGGAGELLRVLDGDARTFTRWAKGYYEIRLDARAVGALFGGARVSEELIRGLSPTFDVKTAFRLARRLALKTEEKIVTRSEKAAGDGRKKKVTIDDDDGPIGDAEFKVVEIDGETMLIIGGKPQLKSKKRNLYMKLLGAVRSAIKGAR
jgi:hypothetical protein